MQKTIDNFDSLTEEIMTNYAGQWIALIKGKVVAHGKSFKEVHKKVEEKYPNEKPLYGKLPDAVPSVFNII